jgi:predicted alpha/beta hydrolase
VARESDTRIWVFIVLVLVVVVALVAAFFWYLDAVGTADGPEEGMRQWRGELSGRVG